MGIVGQNIFSQGRSSNEKKYANLKFLLHYNRFISYICIKFTNIDNKQVICMLLEFKVRNFRSIREELTLSMLASGRVGKNDLPDNVFQVGKHKAVKSLIMYGRNASGKSNILSALLAFQYLVEKSDRFKINEKISSYIPFLLDEDYINEPTKFEIEFIGYDNNRYKYLFEYNAVEILKEELYFYPKGVKSRLFKRTKMNFFYGEYFTGNRKLIENEILCNQLFLSKSATSRFMYINEAYSYLGYFIEIIINRYTDSDIGWKLELISGVQNDTKSLKNIIKLLKEADTSIQDLKLNKKLIAESKSSQNDMPSFHNEPISYWSTEEVQIKTIHPVFENDKISRITEFGLNQESKGTKKLLSLSPQILASLNIGGVLVIDELDNSLHPLLTRMLISLFHNPKTNPKNAQLIFATHDSSLLDAELFRRDQIAFVEKENQGNTQLYRLSDIKGVRKDIPIDKWYMSGRFGAIPVISDFDFDFDELQEH